MEKIEKLQEFNWLEGRDALTIALDNTIIKKLNEVIDYLNFKENLFTEKEEELEDFISQELDKAREEGRKEGWEDCETFYGDMRKILRPYHVEAEDYRTTLKRLLSKLKE